MDEATQERRVDDPTRGWFTWGTIIVPTATLLFWIVGAAGIGYNSEQVAGFNLHPHQTVLADREDSESECEGGVRKQGDSPILSVCVGEQRLPLLLKYYIGGVTYWPFIGLVKLLDIQEPLAFRCLMWPLLALLLWAMGRLLVDASAPKGARILAPALFAFFPVSILYGTTYLYEWLPVVLTFSGLLLLRRWNQRGLVAYPILSAVLFGLAIHQKLTYAPVVAVVLISFVLVFKLRRMSTPLLWFCGGLVCLGPIILWGLMLSSGPNPVLGVPGGGGSGGPLVGLAVVAGAIFMTDLVTPSLPIIAANIGALLALLAYGAWKIHRFRCGDPRTPVPAFVAGVLWGVIPLFVVIYTWNETSVPSLPLMPFVVILAACALLDGAAWLRRRTGLGRAILPVMVGLLLLGAGLRAAQFLEVKARWPAHFSLSTQREVVSWIIDHDALDPLMESTRNYDGVFEFLSNGRVRPRYLDTEESGRRGAWEEALQRAGDEPVFALLVREVWPRDGGPDSVDDETLAAAAEASHRPILRQEAIVDAEGRPTFALVWLGAPVAPGTEMHLPGPSFQ